jgi:tetratricopeptide (TPR) repeat protein
MANDWFRKTTWSEADQVDFFARLKRSRTVGNKAQYLRIQASHLEEVGSPELVRAALTLLEKIFTEFPVQFELASTYSQKASCLAKLGEIDQALACYRFVFDTERKFPNIRTRSYIKFGRLVVENKLTQFFDEALAVFDELHLNGIEFPADVYETFGIRAIIAAQRGETEKANELANVALEAAAKVHSGFRYHPTAGLVRDRESSFYKTIEAITTNHIKRFAKRFFP